MFIYLFSYGGFFLYCANVGDMSSVTSLSVSTSRVTAGPNNLVIHSIPVSKPTSDNIVACVSPSFRKIDETHLVTWIEMHRLMGIQHFTIYNYSLPIEVDKVLGYYLENDVVTILEWHTKSIPISTDMRWPPIKDAMYFFGQTEAFNDCLYRWTNRFKYLAFVDLFGVFTPRDRRQLNRIMKSIQSKFVTEDIDLFEFYVTYLRRNYRLESIVDAHPVLSERKNVFFERSRHDKIYTLRTRLPRLIIQGDNVKMFSLQTAIKTWRLSSNRVRVLPKYGSLFYYDDSVTARRSRYHGRRDSPHSAFLRRLLKRVDRTLKSIGLQ